MLFSGYFWAVTCSGEASRANNRSQRGAFRVRMCSPSGNCSARAHEVPLTDLQPIVPEDVVGGRGVKVEVGQGPVLQQLQPCELHFAVPRFYGDGLALGAIDLPRLDRVQPRNRFLDPGDEFGEAFF